MSFRLVAAEAGEDLERARALIREYADSLGLDLPFQEFEEEMRTLPGEYAPPGGRLWIAFEADRPAGCVALRRLEEGIAEMKRLYVRPEFRGRDLGRGLAAAAIDLARELGYRAVRLDTLASMAAARSLYRSLGFREIAPYRHNPIPGTGFFELSLR